MAEVYYEMYRGEDDEFAILIEPHNLDIGNVTAEVKDKSVTLVYGENRLELQDVVRKYIGYLLDTEEVLIGEAQKDGTIVRSYPAQVVVKR
jgi:hypothetical protein